MRQVVNVLCSAILLVACTGNKDGLPTSTGKAYEVLVVSDHVNTARSITAKLSTPVQGLPQAEPQFDVDTCSVGRFTGAQQLVRNIIITDVDKKLYTKVTVNWQRNIYAEPQMVIRLQAPDWESLQREVLNGKTGRDLLSLLNRHELTIQKSLLQRHHQPKAEERIRKMFGVDMRIPADMLSSKEGQDFLWLSNNANTSMQNICIFSSENIDSVLRTHIKGETDEMYMTLRKGPSVNTLKTDNRAITGEETLRRGLWEMEGDAMGGPFVARTYTLPKGRRITVLAFVYAPESAKRNKMRQLEAVLYTLKPQKE